MSLRTRGRWFLLFVAWATLTYVGVNYGDRIALGGAYDAPAKLRDMLTSPRAEDRWAAADRLGKLRDATAVPSLAAALADKPGTQRPCRISAALGEIGSEEAVPALERALLLPDSSTDTRRCASEALAKIGGTEALAALARAERMGISIDPAVRALERRGDSGALALLARDRHARNAAGFENAATGREERTPASDGDREDSR
ncbi:MAG: HEAT repeat domain-containing protein [Armatimonadetes bacterium]|nr:HEAT repeat domain-containing protein [Armatimonadota bacterium]